MPAKTPPLAPKPYIALINKFYLRPIRSREELDQAIEVLDSLIDREDLSDAGQGHLDVLADLVEAYEEEHIKLPPVSGVDMLKGMISDKGLSRTEVARGAGMVVTTLNDIITGRRKMNLGHMKKLEAYFHTDPSLFMLEEEAKKASP